MVSFLPLQSYQSQLKHELTTPVMLLAQLFALVKATLYIIINAGDKRHQSYKNVKMKIIDIEIKTIRECWTLMVMTYYPSSQSKISYTQQQTYVLHIAKNHKPYRNFIR